MGGTVKQTTLYIVIIAIVVIVAIVAIVAIVVIVVIVTTALQCSQDAEIKTSLTDYVTRSPIELSWTAEKILYQIDKN